MLKCILYSVFFLAPFGCNAQVQNTLYQNLATNSTTATPRLLGPVRNIGQSAHQVVVKFTDVPTMVCRVGTAIARPSVTLVGSYVPNVVFTDTYKLVTKTFTQSTSADFTVTIQGEGAYPYIFVYVSSFDTTNCRYTVDYSGTLYPFPVITTNWDFFRARVSSTTATTTPIVLGSTSILGAILNVQRITVSSAAANTVSIHCASTPLVYQQRFPLMAAGSTVVVEYTDSPIVECQSDDGISFTTTAADEVDITVYFKISLQELQP